MYPNTRGEQLGVGIQQGGMSREVAQGEGGGRARGLQHRREVGFHSSDGCQAGVAYIHTLTYTHTLGHLLANTHTHTWLF